MRDIILKECIEREYRKYKRPDKTKQQLMQAIAERLGVPVREVIAVVAKIEVTEGA